MDNETMVERIQAGERNLLLDLWENNRGFIRKMAYKRWAGMQAAGAKSTCDLEDLMQSGYLALVDAAERHASDAQYGFLSTLKFSLLREFEKNTGWWRSKRDDALHFAASLDVPLGENEDGGTLQDIVADPADAYEDVDERIWREQLHNTVSEIMATLKADQQRVLELRFMRGRTRKETAAIMGISGYEVCALEERARRNFADCSITREALEGFIDFKTKWFYRVSLQQAQWTSPVETLVMRREEFRKRAERRYMIEEDST